MAEICCEVLGKIESPVSPCEASSRAARRRRAGIRRLRLAAGVGLVDRAEEIGQKRRRLGASPSTGSHVAVDLEGNAGDLAERLKLEPHGGSARKGADLCSPRYGVMSVCGRRREMEDAVSVRPDFVRRASESDGGSHHFFGVYDGHGCSHVAAMCRDQMHECVADEMSRLGPSPPPPTAWTGLMEQSFSLMDSEAEARRGEPGPPTACCRCDLRAPRCNNVGSTALVAIVGPTHLVVANCGDSRAVLSKGGAAIPLSSDHKPDRPDELNRIEAAGGRVIYWDGARVLGVLAMSRAIGDGYLKPYVISQPEVTVTERSPEDEFLILGSDGLWDVVTNEMACDVVRACLRTKMLGKGEAEGTDGGDRERACSDAAMLLAKLALARQSADNVTAVVVDVRRPARKAPQQTRHQNFRNATKQTCNKK